MLAACVAPGSHIMCTKASERANNYARSPYACMYGRSQRVSGDSSAWSLTPREWSAVYSRNAHQNWEKEKCESLHSDSTIKASGSPLHQQMKCQKRVDEIKTRCSAKYVSRRVVSQFYRWFVKQRTMAFDTRCSRGEQKQTNRVSAGIGMHTRTSQHTAYRPQCATATVMNIARCPLHFLWAERARCAANSQTCYFSLFTLFLFWFFFVFIYRAVCSQ